MSTQQYDTVEFTSMDHGTREDYDLVFEHEADQIATQADRVMD